MTNVAPHFPTTTAIVNFTYTQGRNFKGLTDQKQARINFKNVDGVVEAEIIPWTGDTIVATLTDAVGAGHPTRFSITTNDLHYAEFEVVG